MRKILSFFRSILPHAILIVALMLLTFFVIDLFNESMAFLNNSITKFLLAVLALLSAVLSILTIVEKTPQKTIDPKGENHEI